MDKLIFSPIFIGIQSFLVMHAFQYSYIYIPTHLIMGVTAVVGRER